MIYDMMMMMLLLNRAICESLSLFVVEDRRRRIVTYCFVQSTGDKYT